MAKNARIPGRGQRLRRLLYLVPVLLALSLSVARAEISPEGLRLLIREAFVNNPELQAVEARSAALALRVPQVRSLPDPMVMVGYQNEGYDSITYGEMEGAQAMYTVSQMMPFPGKRRIRSEMAKHEADSASAMHQTARLNVAAQIADVYYSLFLAYKEIDLIREKTSLFGRIEEAALSRYSAGMAPQQEVLMAQTEKYMLLEREIMAVQRIRSLETMLTSLLGRKETAPVERPADPDPTAAYPYNTEELIRMAIATSPEIYALNKMQEARSAGVRMAEREFYPDVTWAVSLFERGGGQEDMVALTASVNIPIFYASRQSQALGEARKLTLEAESDLETAKLRLAATIRERHSMVRSSEELMALYRNGLIPKTYQDFELALSGYVAGQVEAVTVISRLKALVDYETRFWAQAVERERSIAVIETITGRLVTGISVR